MSQKQTIQDSALRRTNISSYKIANNKTINLSTKVQVDSSRIRYLLNPLT